MPHNGIDVENERQESLDIVYCAFSNQGHSLLFFDSLSAV